MEHSALHALLLTSLIVTLGGPFAVLWLLQPAVRTLRLSHGGNAFISRFEQSAERWVIYAACCGTFATFADMFVQVAEVQGKTVFGGVDPALVVRFAGITAVGNFSLLKAGLLLLTAASARIRGQWKWWLTAFLATSAVVAASFVSHAAAQPTYRLLSVTAQVAHIAAGAVWMGVLLHFFFARAEMIRGEPTPERTALVAEMVRRFSPVALAMTSLLALTGLLGAFRFVGHFSALFTSAYGLTLLVKLTLILPAVFAGFVNFRYIRPLLLDGNKQSPATRISTLQWFSRTLELEVTAGVLVITVAGILASVSPPGRDNSLRLTDAQTRALLSPHLPRTEVTDPNQWVGAATRKIDDLRYSEFTHNWSGVMVFLMGMGWLAQAIGGRAGKWASRLYPFLLIPFGFFIGIAADPEVWWLHQVTFRQAISDPQLLEHQLGAAMVFLLAWLSWRDQKNPERSRPLGYALPVIMIAGSLLLLGHAHSTLTVTDDLTNLINVQHAILGTFGLLAGTIRLLVLRDLVRMPPARLLWACGVIGLGLFMAFFYREVV